jgi:hypothetical protein
MQSLEYANPSTTRPSMADNFPFRVVIAVLGVLWNGLFAASLFNLGESVDRVVAGARAHSHAPLPDDVMRLVSMRLHHAAPLAVMLLSIALAGLAIALFVHACRHARDRSGFIAWPRWYWPIKAVLMMLLLVALWLQHLLYRHLSMHLAPWTDHLQNPAFDDAFAGFVVSCIAVAFGLLPVLSMSRGRATAPRPVREVPS